MVDPGARYLTTEDLICLAREMGVPLVRDEGVLAVAAARAQATVRGVEVYDTLEAKGAALLLELVVGRPLDTGSRRFAWHALTVFLRMNGRRVTATDDDVLRLIDEVASREVSSVDEIAARLTTRPR